MAKGGNRPTSFDVAGRDPMGIGVADPSQMMEAFYRASEFTRKPFEETRQRREREKGQRREDYKEFVANMPTYEGLTAQATSEINQKLQDMRQLAEQKMLSGPFFSVARTEEGAKAQDELNKINREVVDMGAKYEAIKTRVGPQITFAADPRNQDQINQKRTTERWNEYNQAKNIDELDMATQEPMVVMKPKPQDLYGYVGKIMSNVVKGGGLSQKAKYDYDETTGLYTVSTDEKRDPDLIHKHFVSGYRAADPEMRDYIDEQHTNAPEASWYDDEKVKMPVEDWFANQFSGLFGATRKETVQRMPKYGRGDYQYGRGVPRTPAGDIDVEQIKKPTEMKATISRSVTPVKRTRKFGKRKGEPVYGDVKVSPGETIDVSYNTAEIPLSSLAEPFNLLTQPGSIETYTGKKPPVGQATRNDPVSAIFYPIYMGEDTETIPIEYTDETGARYVDTHTLRKGDPIPDNIQDKIAARLIEYRPFMLNQSSYGAQIEKPAGMSWKDYISKHGKAVLTPWDNAKPQYFDMLRAEGVPESVLKELEKDMYDTYNNLNGGTYNGTFGAPPPDASLQERFDSVFGE